MSTSTASKYFGLATILTAVLGATNVQATLLLHSTLDDAQSIFRPAVAAGQYANMSDAIPGPGNVSYESGQDGSAARINAGGFQPDWPVDGPIRFHGDNFDFDDPDDDGGRLDFWVKFNVDPHGTTANTWLARSNWGERYINYEFSGNSGENANMMIDVYGAEVHNERTNYRKFRLTPRSWQDYQDIQQGEWNVFTFTWRRNGGPHKAEIHLYINGTQEGCTGCNDYNGNLPPEDSVTDFFLAPLLNGNHIQFSIDDVYSFDSWDVSGISGNFPQLQIPEGVTLKYPMDNRYPTWGMTVETSDVTFEFQVANDVNESCDCDLYVDDVYVDTVTTSDLAHTEIAYPGSLANGTYTWQVKCDEDRLVSPVNQFRIGAQGGTPNEQRSFGSIKGLFGQD